MILLVIGALRTHNVFENLQRMKYYLAILLCLIVVIGFLDVSEILGSLEHESSPSKETYFCIFLVPWYLLMMVGDILLISYQNLKYGNRYIGLLSVGIIGPAIIYFLIISS